MIYAVTRMTNWFLSNHRPLFITRDREAAIAYMHTIHRVRGYVDPIQGFGTATHIPEGEGKEGFSIRNPSWRELAWWEEIGYDITLDKPVQEIPMPEEEEVRYYEWKD